MRLSETQPATETTETAPGRHLPHSRDTLQPSRSEPPAARHADPDGHSVRDAFVGSRLPVGPQRTSHTPIPGAPGEARAAALTARNEGGAVEQTRTFDYVGVDHELCEVVVPDAAFDNFGCAFGAGMLRTNLRASIADTALARLRDPVTHELAVERIAAVLDEPTDPLHEQVRSVVGAMGRDLGKILAGLRLGTASSKHSDEWAGLRRGIDTVILCDGLIHLRSIARMLVVAARAELSERRITMTFVCEPEVDLARGALASLPRDALERMLARGAAFLAIDAGTSAIKVVLARPVGSVDSVDVERLAAQRVGHDRSEGDARALETFGGAIAAATRQSARPTLYAVVAWCGNVSRAGVLLESYAFPTFGSRPTLDADLTAAAVRQGARGVGCLNFTHTNDALLAGAAMVAQHPEVRGHDVAVITCGSGPGFAHIRC